MNFSALKNRARAKGFTLVELLVVIAILSILAAVALPAYNNYSLKTKFTEVTLATAPIKTFVSTCAVSGDCVQGSAISLAIASSGSGSAPSIPVSEQPMYAYFNAWLTAVGDTASANNSASLVADANAFTGFNYRVLPDPANASNTCLIPTGQTACVLISNKGTTYSSSVPTSSIQTFAALTGGSAGSVVVPCVGSATGCSPSTKYTLSASADSSGVITATAQTSSGLKGETFVLSPALSGGRVDWSVSGTCKTRAGGALC